MQECFATISVEKPKPLREQIRQRVREFILDGTLAPGDQLPSTEALAAKWQTHPPTVHAAMRALVTEGLLERRHGKGTFVRQREARLERVAVYCTGDLMGERASAFQRSLTGEIQQALARKQIQADMWMDSRPEAEQRAPWPPLVRAAQDRRVQGLIVPVTDLPHLRWLRKLPVPAAFLAPEPLANAVGFDLRQLVELSLRHLAARGCRSVGLICPHPTDGATLSGAVHSYTTYYATFMEVARGLGLRVRNEWVRAPRGPQAWHGGDQQAVYGRAEFHELWNQSARPDGLLVEPDSVAQGVVLAIAERQVRIPQDLQAVLHKNANINFLCPFPVTYVVSSERAVAEALLQQVRNQFRGEKCQPVLVPYGLEPRETSARKGKGHSS